MKDAQTKIINHISRLEGQLASVKKAVALENPDCTQASKTLLSASRSFAGLREEFVEAYLKRYFIDEKLVKNDETLESLLALIKG